MPITITPHSEGAILASQVELAGGPTNRNKLFLIRGVTPAELAAMMVAKLA